MFAMDPELQNYHDTGTTSRHGNIELKFPDSEEAPVIFGPAAAGTAQQPF
jgi:hypothetical protein